MPIKFQKTEEKLRKNLIKQFETFNKPEDDSEGSKKYDSDGVKNKKSNLTEQKPPKSMLHTEMTTQAKSPLVKSGSGSKARPVQNQKAPDQLSGNVSNNKSIKSSKKSLHESLSKTRQYTPVEELARSRQSSPEAQRVYSKMSSYDKRVFSKMSNYKKPQISINDHQATYAAKSSSKASFSKVQIEKITQTQNSKHSMKPKPSNQKSITKQKKSSIKNLQSDNYQISFPQMITQSESVYPSSSQPNTGKESQKPNQQNWERKRNSNITEQQENQVQEHFHEDYISEGQLQEEQLMEPSNPSSMISQTSFDEADFIDSGYQQLPKSYLIAMQILQTKLSEQQTTIKRYRKKVEKQNSRFKKLETEITSLKQLIQEQETIISQKDAQIKFLKGYLDEEKHNNREALKQIAKNVYERSISGKKFVPTNIQDSEPKLTKKTKKQLFSQSQKENSQQVETEEKLQSSEEKQQGGKEDESTGNLNQNHANQPVQMEKNSSKSKIKQQKVHSKTVNQTETGQKQHLKETLLEQQKQKLRLEQELAHQQDIKDQMMRQHLLREQAIQKSVQKRYNYLEQSRKNERSMSVKESYPNTMKKLQTFGRNQRQVNQEGQKQLYSDGKRMRSMSTAIKQLDEQKNPNITYRPRNTQISNVLPSFPNREPTLLNPSVQSIMDPVLERYINAKSDISSYRLKNQTGYFNEASDLKSDKKHKQAVSQMRELMRGEKELVALNYRLEAIEKKILQCVKSTGKDEKIPKSVREQAEQKILLEDLQKQYAVLKKEFERKQLSVKQLKLNLEQK